MAAIPTLRLVAPANKKRTVAAPRRKRNADYRSREHLTEREVERLVEAAKEQPMGPPRDSQNKTEAIAEQQKAHGPKAPWAFSVRAAMAANAIRVSIARQHSLPKRSARNQDGDEPERQQQHAKPGCHPALSVIGCLGDGKDGRRGRRHGSADCVSGGRCGCQKLLHVNLAGCALIRHEPIGLEVFDRCRRHQGRDRHSRDGSGISHLDVGGGPHRLRGFRRRRA